MKSLTAAQWPVYKAAYDGAMAAIAADPDAAFGQSNNTDDAQRAAALEVLVYARNAAYKVGDDWPDIALVRRAAEDAAHDYMEGSSDQVTRAALNVGRD